MLDDVKDWLRDGGRALREWLADGWFMVRQWFKKPLTEAERHAIFMAHIQSHRDSMNEISGVNSVMRGGEHD
jgi:hypothetical protein